MARGNNNGDGGMDMYFMKVKGLKKGEKVYIEQTKAVGEKKYEKLDETIRSISGAFHDIRFREYEHEGDKITEVQVWLKDRLAGNNGEMYALSFGLNSVGRSIMNSLLSIEGSIGTLDFRFYNKKDTGYANVYIEHNGTKIGWKYNLDEFQHLITESTVKRKGQTVIEKDYTDLDNMLMNQIKEVILPKLNRSATTSDAPTAQNDTKRQGDGPTDDDDLPF